MLLVGRGAFLRLDASGWGDSRACGCSAYRAVVVVAVPVPNCRPRLVIVVIIHNHLGLQDVI